MFQPTINTEERLMLLANNLYCISAKRDADYIDDLVGSKPRVKLKKPEMDEITDIWLEHDAFKEKYEALLAKYFTEAKAYADITDEDRAANDGKYKKTIYSIGPKGKPEIKNFNPAYFHPTFTEGELSLEAFDAITKKLLSLRTSLFKSKKKLAALSEEHKALRRTLSASMEKAIQEAPEKVFLKAFSFAFRPNFDGTPYLYRYILRGFENAGVLTLPAFLFSDSLYDMKDKSYKKYNARGTVTLSWRVALALITKDLQAAEGDAFFKKKVTEADVLAEVKKQAKADAELAKKLDLTFVCRLLNAQLKELKKPKDVSLTLPYMGLERLSEEELGAVAAQIFHYYTLVSSYPRYEKWFNNYPMAQYLKSLEPEKPRARYDWKREAAAVLPYGEKDLPYFEHYLRALDTNRFHTYYDLCAYMKSIREKDEMTRRVQRIEATQRVIVQQNNTIMTNQVKLYEQNAQHHRERMQAEAMAYMGVMSKLDDIQRSIDRQDVIIYY